MFKNAYHSVMEFLGDRWDSVKESLEDSWDDGIGKQIVWVIVSTALLFATAWGMDRFENHYPILVLCRVLFLLSLPGVLVGAFYTVLFIWLIGPLVALIVTVIITVITAVLLVLAMLIGIAVLIVKWIFG